MDEADWLGKQFEASRPRLWAVAYRMLGSRAEADDAVQEMWFRLDRADPAGIENLGGWLTTVISRVCMDRLRSRRSRPEEPVGTQPVGDGDGPAADDDPEHQTVMAESIGAALLVVLDVLAPAERVAFVLHDVFAVPFDEIGQIVGRSPEAARKLASRARRRVQGSSTLPDFDLVRQREVVEAFLSATRDGDFAALLVLLDREVVLRTDVGAMRMGAPSETRGAAEVAAALSGGAAQAAQLALLDGVPGLAWAPGGRPRAVIAFAITGGKVVAISLIGDPDRLRQLDIVLLDS